MRSQIILIACAGLMLLSLEASAKTLLTFEGEMDFSNKKVDVLVQFDEEHSIRAMAQQKEVDFYQIIFDVQRLETPMFDLSTEIKTDLKWVNDETTRQTYLAGEIQTQYALVDYKPIDDFKGKFAIKDKKIYIQSLRSTQLAASGEIDLTGKANLNLAFDLNNVNLNDFLNFWMRTKTYDSDGLVSGTIQAQGHIKELVLQGDLEAHDGFIKAFEFDHIYLDAEGVYPYLTVSNAQVANADGLSFALTGALDMSKRKTFKQQIKDMAITPLVKGTGDQAEWTIRSTKDAEGSGKYELKYLLRKDEFEKDHEDKAAGILGIQRSMEF